MKYIQKAVSLLFATAAGYGYGYYRHTKNKAASSVQTSNSTALQPVMSHSDVFDPSALNGQVSIPEAADPDSALFHFLFGPIQVKPTQIIFRQLDPVLKTESSSVASDRSLPSTGSKIR